MKQLCFAEDDRGMCDALEDSVCLSHDCPFFATEKDHRRSVRIAQSRLSELPMEQQEHIASKYYKGKMPWNQ